MVYSLVYICLFFFYTKKYLTVNITVKGNIKKMIKIALICFVYLKDIDLWA